MTAGQEVNESEKSMYVNVAQQRVMQEGDLFSNRALGVAGSRGPSGLQAPCGSVGWVLVGGMPGPELQTPMPSCYDLPPAYPTQRSMASFSCIWILILTWTQIRICTGQFEAFSKLMKTEKLLTHEGDLSLMSSPHGEVASLVQNNKTENVLSFSLDSNL